MDLIPGFNGLDKEDSKTRQETFKVWDLVSYIRDLTVNIIEGASILLHFFKPMQHVKDYDETFLLKKSWDDCQDNFLCYVSTHQSCLVMSWRCITTICGVSQGYHFCPIPASLRDYPDSKVHGANMGSTWGWQDPGGPHVGHMNLAIWDWDLGN